jgi:hypothetical protein
MAKEGSVGFTRTIVHKIGYFLSNILFTRPNKTKFFSYSPPPLEREYMIKFYHIVDFNTETEV